jgi:hypothetical protein
LIPAALTNWLCARLGQSCPKRSQDGFSYISRYQSPNGKKMQPVQMWGHKGLVVKSATAQAFKP